MRNLGIEQISFFSEISDEYEFEIQEMEVEEDHVHILISFHPMFAPFARLNILPHTASLYKSFSALLLFT